MPPAISRRSFCAAVGATVATTLIPGCSGTTSGAEDALPADLARADLSPVADLATLPDLAPPSDLFGVCAPGPTALAAGPAATLPIGQVRHFAQQGLFLCRDAQGLYALTDACPHQGCPVDFVSAQAGFNCKCHGSNFDANGALKRGPALASLEHYAVCLDGQNNAVILVDTKVAPNVRT